MNSKSVYKSINLSITANIVFDIFICLSTVDQGKVLINNIVALFKDLLYT